MNTRAAELLLHQAEALLRTSLHLVQRSITTPGTIDDEAARGAAWRVADAGLLLRQALEAVEAAEGCGLTWPTGRQVELPRLPELAQ